MISSPNTSYPLPEFLSGDLSGLPFSCRSKKDALPTSGRVVRMGIDHHRQEVKRKQSNWLVDSISSPLDHLPGLLNKDASHHNQLFVFIYHIYLL